MSHLCLAHHGIKGMKWGVRRFRNEDGTLTEAGRKRYKIDSKGNLQKLTKEERKAVKDEDRNVRRFEQNYKNNWIDSYNKAADQINQWIPSWNAKYDKYDFTSIPNDGTDNPSVPLKTIKAYNEYVTGYGNKWAQVYSDVLLSDFGEHPRLGKDWVKIAPFMSNGSDMPSVSVNIDARRDRYLTDRKKSVNPIPSSYFKDIGLDDDVEMSPADIRDLELAYLEKQGY